MNYGLQFMEMPHQQYEINEARVKPRRPKFNWVEGKPNPRKPQLDSITERESMLPEKRSLFVNIFQLGGWIISEIVGIERS